MRLLICLFAVAATIIVAPPSFAQKIEKRQIRSSVLNEKRPVLISKPEQWDGKSHKLPVLILLDAEEHMPFIAALANSHSDYGYASQDPFPDMLVVGVPNTNRSRDMSTAPQDGMPNGTAELFLRFIETELIPFIEEDYHVSTYRTVCAHSASGEFAVFTMAQSPDLFDGYFLAEPSIDARDYELADRIGATMRTGALDETRICMSVAGQLHHFRLGAAKLAAVFEHADEENRRQTQEFVTETHYTVPVMTFHYGVRHIFAEALAPDPVVSKGLNAVLAHRADYCARVGCDALLPRAQAERVAKFQTGRGDYEEAIKAWEYYRTNYPNLPQPYYGLADAQ